jgi:hypothetical protein
MNDDALAFEYVSSSLPEIIGYAANPGCEICFGTAWVCESHPLRPWDSGTPSDCQCGAAGMPCRCTGFDGPREPAPSQGPSPLGDQPDLTGGQG